MITKKDLDGAIENAVGQISSAVIKALENTATKDDLKNLATKDDINGVESRLDGVEKELKIVNRKIDILQKTTPSKVEFKEHGKRISRLEKTVFVTS